MYSVVPPIPRSELKRARSERKGQFKIRFKMMDPLSGADSLCLQDLVPPPDPSTLSLTTLAPPMHHMGTHHLGPINSSCGPFQMDHSSMGHMDQKKRGECSSHSSLPSPCNAVELDSFRRILYPPTEDTFDERDCLPDVRQTNTSRPIFKEVSL